MTVLPRVADALKGRLPIIIDGGVYRGQDIFRALALGASIVALGRPLLYGSALCGPSVPPDPPLSHVRFVLVTEVVTSCDHSTTGRASQAQMPFFDPDQSHQVFICLTAGFPLCRNAVASP